MAAGLGFSGLFGQAFWELGSADEVRRGLFGRPAKKKTARSPAPFLF
jgi:hypothetical protein